MTLLDEWRNKRSWALTCNFVPIYTSRKTGAQDLDLKALLRAENDLTLDTRTATGLVEIDTAPPEIDGGFFDYPITVPETPEDAAKRLLQIIKNYFERLWDHHTPHLIYCSAGRDSRILAWTLRNLEREGMDLGEYLFVCHEPEQDLFTRAMDELQVSHEHICVYKKDHLREPDYYRVPELYSYNTNGFIGPFPQSFPADIIPKHWCLVSGFGGGELTDYPVHRGIDHINYGIWTRYLPWPTALLCEEYYNWGDLLYPYCSYEYMNYMFHLPSKFFPLKTWDEHGDLLRDTMLKLLGNMTEFYYGHEYNHRLSPEMKTHVNAEFQHSKFCKRFANEIIDGKLKVKDMLPGDNIYHQTDIASKLYGLASIFEGLSE